MRIVPLETMLADALATRTEREVFGKIVRSGDCWLWQGLLSNNGTPMAGRLDRDGSFSVRAYIAEILMPWVQGYVSVSCRNKRCVSPHHIRKYEGAYSYPLSRPCRHGHKASERRRYGRRIVCKGCEREKYNRRTLTTHGHSV